VTVIQWVVLKIKQVDGQLNRINVQIVRKRTVIETDTSGQLKQEDQIL
jgi:hypothetical protein